MSQSDRPVRAYEPDLTPNDLVDEVGMDLAVLAAPPTAPTVAGETFTDGDGNRRHVGPRTDGRPVQLRTGSVADSGTANTEETR